MLWSDIHVQGYRGQITNGNLGRKHSENTVKTQWKHSENTVKTQWKHSENRQASQHPMQKATVSVPEHALCPNYMETKNQATHKAGKCTPHFSAILWVVERVTTIQKGLVHPIITIKIQFSGLVNLIVHKAIQKPSLTISCVARTSSWSQWDPNYLRAFFGTIFHHNIISNPRRIETSKLYFLCSTGRQDGSPSLLDYSGFYQCAKEREPKNK